MAPRQLRRIETHSSSFQSCRMCLSRYRSAAGTLAKKPPLMIDSRFCSPSASAALAASAEFSGKSSTAPRRAGFCFIRAWIKAPLAPPTSNANSTEPVSISRAASSMSIPVIPPNGLAEGLPLAGACGRGEVGPQAGAERHFGLRPARPNHLVEPAPRRPVAVACLDHGHSAQRARIVRAQGRQERRRREAPVLIVTHQPVGGTGPHQTKGGVHV